MDRSAEEKEYYAHATVQAEASRIHLLQADYKKAIKEMNRLKILLKELGALVD